MSNHSLVGACIAPFLDASLFPNNQGYVPGRFCEKITFLAGNPTCCLPCPAADWTYPQSLKKTANIAGWLNVAGIVLLSFLLLSYAVLPTQQTRRHYLSVALCIACIMIAVGFTIPLGHQQPECANEITPNDMHDSLNCAWSGTFITSGSLAGVTWITIRALSMHLQICWDIIPGKRFFYVSQVIGWGFPAVLFAIVMASTGVSYRLGSTCVINHHNSMGDFWGPIMAMGGISAVCQIGTFVYCIKVYLQNLWSDQDGVSTNASTGNLPSHKGSFRAQTARAVYQRLKKVLWLQWRGLCIVSILLVNIVYFTVIFVYLDGLQETLEKDWLKASSWIACLVATPNDRERCMPLAAKFLLNEATLVAVLVLLSVTGIQCFLLLARPTIFPAWWELLTKGPAREHDFIDINGSRVDLDRPTSKRVLLNTGGRSGVEFEMQSKGPSYTTVERSVSPISMSGDTYRSMFKELHDSSSVHTAADSITTPKMEKSGLEFPSPVLASSPTMNYPASALRQTYTAYEVQRQSPRMEYVNQVERQHHQGPRINVSAPSSPINPMPSREIGRGGLGLNPPSIRSESPREDFPRGPNGLR